MSSYAEPSPALVIFVGVLGLAIPICLFVALAEDPETLSEGAATTGSILGAWVTYALGKLAAKRWPRHAQTARNGKGALAAAFAVGFTWATLSLLIAWPAQYIFSLFG